MTLADYIAEKLKQPFQYGVNDCVLFTIGWVELASGEKYLPKKIWTNEQQALATLKRRGGLIKVFDKHFERIQPNYAVDGDIALVEDVASLFSASHCVSTGKDGLVFRNRLLAAMAWRTPCRK